MFKIHILCLILFSFVNSTTSFNVSHDFEIFKTIFSNGLLPELGKHIEERENYNLTKCLKDILIWKNDFLDKKLWAWKMLDSAGKFPSGILTLNIQDYGNFDECLSINKDDNIKGKHCLAKIPLLSLNSTYETVRDIEEVFGLQQNFKNHDGINARFFNIDKYLRLSLVLGICIPDSCDTDEIRSVFNSILEQNNINEPFITIPEEECSTKEPLTWSSTDWGALSFFIIFAIIILLSTLFDIVINFLKKQENVRWQNFLISFSIVSNTKKLIMTSKSSTNLKCLHGIRVLSLFWIILGHRYMFEFFKPSLNFTNVASWLVNTGSLIILCGDFAVDTFFVLSGTLVAYISLKQFNKDKCFNFPLMYFHRYLRLTPALAALLFFHVTLYKFIGDGPIWKIFILGEIVPCEEYWWSTILYVQNYVNPNIICLSHTWYLSVDMQLFILSPIIIYPLLKWKRVGLANLIFWILVSQTTTAVLAYVNKYPAASVGLEDATDRQLYFSLPTHTRATPWLLGFLLGYFLHLSKEKRIKMNMAVVTIGWICCFLLMAAVIFGLGVFQDYSHKSNLLQDGSFNAFSKTAWSVVILWLILACTQGYGGPVNQFLSLPIWEFLGKFSYAMYLVHMPIQIANMAMLRTSGYFSDYMTVITFFGDLIISFLIGYILLISFESPFVALEKNIFYKKKSSITVERKLTHDDAVEINTNN